MYRITIIFEDGSRHSYVLLAASFDAALDAASERFPGAVYYCARDIVVQIADAARIAYHHLENRTHA